jgi:hypothetical protein
MSVSPAASRRLRVRKFAKRAGAVLVGLVALDLIATAATVALGWGMFNR